MLKLEKKIEIYWRLCTGSLSSDLKIANQVRLAIKRLGERCLQNPDYLIDRSQKDEEGNIRYLNGSELGLSGLDNVKLNFLYGSFGFFSNTNRLMYIERHNDSGDVPEAEREYNFEIICGQDVGSLAERDYTLRKQAVDIGKVLIKLAEGNSDTSHIFHEIGHLHNLKKMKYVDAKKLWKNRSSLISNLLPELDVESYPKLMEFIFRHVKYFIGEDKNLFLSKYPSAQIFILSLEKDMESILYSSYAYNYHSPQTIKEQISSSKKSVIQGLEDRKRSLRKQLALIWQDFKDGEFEKKE